MDEDRAHRLTKEVHELLNGLIESIQDHYPKVRDAYQTVYNWPNLDPVRREAALCVALGLPQAAIVLTNHLLETLLKEVLIVHHSKEAVRAAGGDTVEAVIKGTAEARARFGSADLGKTINAIRAAGFVSKHQQSELHGVRERFRNAYSHADREKIFRGVTVPIQPVTLEDGHLVAGESQVVNVAEFPIAQGLLQAHLAQQDARAYFLYIDSLARELWSKLFPDAAPPSLR